MLLGDWAHPREERSPSFNFRMHWFPAEFKTNGSMTLVGRDTTRLMHCGGTDGTEMSLGESGGHAASFVYETSRIPPHPSYTMAIAAMEVPGICNYLCRCVSK